MQNSVYSIKFNPNKLELSAAYHLRARVFCKELQWADSVHGLDIDQFDSIAEQIVILTSTGKVCATTRLIMGYKPWMMEKTFQDIIPKNFSPNWKTAAAEVSRFTVDREYRCKKHDQWTIADTLIKAIYLRCRQYSLEKIYMITSREMVRFLLFHGYPIKVVGTEKIMTDGVTAIMSTIRWDDLIFGTQPKELKISQWFTEQFQINPAYIATETA